MKLRTQLVLAFLLLSVVPLAGLVSYSYVSSLRVFRRAVWAESQSLALEMEQRLGAAGCASSAGSTSPRSPRKIRRLGWKRRERGDRARDRREGR